MQDLEERPPKNLVAHPLDLLILTELAIGVYVSGWLSEVKHV